MKISSDKYKGYQVTVEGHTDDSPIRTRRFPSNWELSTARAAAVVHFLLQQGIPAQKLRAAGYADTFPVSPTAVLTEKPFPQTRPAIVASLSSSKKLTKPNRNGASWSLQRDSHMERRLVIPPRNARDHEELVSSVGPFDVLEPLAATTMWILHHDPA